MSFDDINKSYEQYEKRQEKITKQYERDLETYNYFRDMKLYSY